MFREFFKQRIQRGLVRRMNNLKIARLAKRVVRESPMPSGAPVAFFKASTGIDDLSWNSGFHLLASWALRLKGIPVAYFACHSGMSHCVLGTYRDNVRKAPPCQSCIYQSQTLYTSVPSKVDGQTTNVTWFNFDRDKELEAALVNLGIEELSKFEWKLDRSHVVASPRGEAASSLPLGPLCLPGLRWILRIHH